MPETARTAQLPSPGSASIVSASTCGHLHLLAADHGPATAARTARAMVVSARRNGDAPQDSAMLRHRDHLVDAVHRAQDVLDARFAETIPLHRLAAAVGVSERTLTRRFRAATGTTPLRYQQALRVEHAEHLVAQNWTSDAAARHVGFGDARMLRRLRAAGRADDRQPRPRPAPTATGRPASEDHADHDPG